MNVEFEYQSHMGTETGQLKSRKYVRDAIAQFYQDEKEKPENTESFIVYSTQGLEELAEEQRNGRPK